MKICVDRWIYITKKNEVLIFDNKLNLIKRVNISNVDCFNNYFIDINKNIAKIYKETSLYHSIELPKEVNNFIIDNHYIYGYEKNNLFIISLIGNKVVFNASVKTDIKKLILKESSLFIHTKESIIILDVLKKKIVFTLPFVSEILDTDGKNIVTYKDGVIYKIDLDKHITKHKINKKIDKIQISNQYIVFISNKQLYLLYNKELKLISKSQFFQICGENIYSFEEKLKKYNIPSLLNHETIKFLTVDDSTTMRMIIKNAILNNFDDVEVFEAKNGKKALDLLEKHPDINVIFMDWNMPVMDGKETVIKIRENPKYDHIKIIMATTEGGKEKVREMINYGVKGYLVKPLKPTSVVPVVEKMIELVKEEKDV